MRHTVILTSLVIIALMLATDASAQTARETQKESERQKKSSQPQTERRDEQQSSEVLKVDTNLVTVPLLVSNRNGVYISDLRREEFNIYEDGVRQEVSFFATTKEPFHVILMLDTSGSTKEKLYEIQRAAIAFIEQLQPADRVKVISFDDEIRDLNDFTNDRAVLSRAVKRTRPGEGTKLYDAVQQAIFTLQQIERRKAIVLFTDGVDYRSLMTRYKDNMRAIEESGIIVYPIRYDTREDTERLVRGQAGDGQAPGLSTIRGGASPGTTAPTFPGGESTPTRRTGGQSGTSGLPAPPVIMGRPGTDPNGDRRYPDGRDTGSRSPDRRDSPTMKRGRRDDSISRMLDGLYFTADSYLKEIAEKSGGALHRADTLRSLPEAFAQIAAELRTQYTLGYYPTNAARDGSYRKIKVQATRRDVAVRARPGYRAPGGIE